MVDNVQVNPMVGGAIIATDEIDGVQYQRIKVGYGVDGAFHDVHSGDPLPALLLSGTVVGSARLTVPAAGVAVQLPDQAGVYGVTVRASLANVGTVYVGGPSVSAADGFELAPGEAVSLDVDNPNAVFIDAQQDGDAVCLLWVSV